jgi:hypothetical protein
MNIGTVVEGPTDRLVLEAVLNEICPGEHRFFPLQPTMTFGETGTGWKGVRRWCRETWQREGASLEKILSGDTGSPLDLLVIQVDADIAAEPDLQEGEETPIQNVQQPCPPAAATANQLARIIVRWLQVEDFPPKVILAIPAQDTENWTFAALFPDDELCARDDYECIMRGRHRPNYCLTLRKYGRLLRRSGGTIKKPVSGYRKVAPQVAIGWNTVCRICHQAQQFTLDLQNFLNTQ